MSGLAGKVWLGVNHSEQAKKTHINKGTSGSTCCFVDIQTSSAPSLRAAWLARTSNRIVLFLWIISSFLLTRHLMAALKKQQQTSHQESKSEHTSFLPPPLSLSSRLPPAPAAASPGGDASAPHRRGGGPGTCACVNAHEAFKLLESSAAMRTSNPKGS